MPNPSMAAAMAPKLALTVNFPSTWNEVAESPLLKDQWPLRLAGPRMIACRAKSVGVRGPPALSSHRDYLELGSLTRLMADLLPFLHRQDPIFRKSPENLQKNCR